MLFAKGLLLEEQGKPDAALAVYEEIERRYGQEKVLDVKKWLEGAAYRKAFLKENGAVKVEGIFKQWVAGWDF